MLSGILCNTLRCSCNRADFYWTNYVFDLENKLCVSPVSPVLIISLAKAIDKYNNNEYVDETSAATDDRVDD